MKMEIKTPQQAAQALEEELSIPAGFLQAIYKEDDWSFVIKGHAFLEAAATHLLTSLAGDRKLEKVFSNLELSNTKTGKLAFLKALSNLSKSERRLIRQFSELRNMLVHDISQASFNLKDYALSLDTKQKQSFVKSFSYFLTGGEIDLKDKKISVEEYVIKEPKKSIWFSLILLLGIIYLLHDTARIKQENEVLKRELGERLLTIS
jgi:hypothetical protein